MNDAILIQHVSENAPHINLLKLIAPFNMTYCLMHKFDYELVINGEATTQGNWDVVRMVRTAMGLPYKFIVYLDVDTIIQDMNADLREACPEGHIGAVRHNLKSPPFASELDHLNVGALYYHNCEATRAFVDKWLAGYPGTTDPPWWEQGVFNRIKDGTVVEIDAKYNSTYPVNNVAHPVVEGFHGRGDVRKRFELMAAAIGK